jgi:hypothetical protein
MDEMIDDAFIGPPASTPATVRTMALSCVLLLALTFVVPAFLRMFMVSCTIILAILTVTMQVLLLIDRPRRARLAGPRPDSAA